MATRQKEEKVTDSHGHGPELPMHACEQTDRRLTASVLRLSLRDTQHTLHCCALALSLDVSVPGAAGSTPDFDLCAIPPGPSPCPPPSPSPVIDSGGGIESL